jgi:hypothetical protein
MMENDTRVRQVVASYRKLAEELATSWGDLAAGIAEKVDQDEYDGKAMLDAWNKTARLSLKTNYQLWDHALGAAAVLGRREGERYEVHSPTFHSPLPGATLTVQGELVGRQSRGALVATVDPQKLAEGATAFRLRADATSCGGDTYVGKVLASGGGEPEPVDVYIVV